MTTIERIFNLIEKSGKSKYALLKEIGLPNSTFSEWSAGRAKPSTEALVKIADYFAVSVDYLLGRPNFFDKFPENFAVFEINGLTEEDVDEVIKYIDYLRYKHKKDD